MEASAKNCDFHAVVEFAEAPDPERRLSQAYDRIVRAAARTSDQGRPIDTETSEKEHSNRDGV
jgi:hypothetical protein